jgi:hypothetical protein
MDMDEQLVQLPLWHVLKDGLPKGYVPRAYIDHNDYWNKADRGVVVTWLADASDIRVANQALAFTCKSRTDSEDEVDYTLMHFDLKETTGPDRLVILKGLWFQHFLYDGCGHYHQETMNGKEYIKDMWSFRSDLPPLPRQHVNVIDGKLLEEGLRLWEL